MTRVSKHKHHIIPQYEGGSDFAENIVELTVIQHAMWHFAEWKRKGNWRDRIAWQGPGIINNAEAVRRAQVLGNKGRKKSKEALEKQSQSKKEQIKRDGPSPNCKDFGKRSKAQWANYTEEERAARCKRHSEAAKRRWAQR